MSAVIQGSRSHHKVLLSAAAILLAASLIGLGAYAGFTGSSSATQSISTGTLDLNLSGAGMATGSVVTGASNLVPGDTLERPVSVNNAGSVDWSSLTLRTQTVSGGSPDLDPLSVAADAPNASGLLITVKNCAGGSWSETAPGSKTYNCSGTASTLVNNATVYASCSGSGVSLACTGSDHNLLGASSVPAAGSAANLLLVTSLASAAGNEAQNQATDVRFTFTATQRAGQNR